MEGGGRGQFCTSRGLIGCSYKYKYEYGYEQFVGGGYCKEIIGPSERGQASDATTTYQHQHNTAIIKKVLLLILKTAKGKNVKHTNR